MPLKKFQVMRTHIKLNQQLLLIQMLMNRAEHVNFLAAYFHVSTRTVARYVSELKTIGAHVETVGKGKYQIKKCPFCDCEK